MELLRWCRIQSDRVGAVLLAVAGGVALLLGWIGLSTKVFPAEQISLIASGGLGGLFLLGTAGILWLSADLHDEWRALDRVDRHLEEIADAWRRQGVDGANESGTGADATTAPAGDTAPPVNLVAVPDRPAQLASRER